jgi:hypothetical protein
MLPIELRGKGDDDTTDTGIDGGQGILNLGQHAARYGSVGLIALEVGTSDEGYH